MVDKIDILKKLEEANISIINEDNIVEGRTKADELGHGTFGLVRKGSLKKENVDVAIKELFFDNSYTPDEVIKEIMNELLAFKIVEKVHESIVKFYGVFIQPKRICFVFELIKGKELSSLYKNMSDKKKLEVIIDICDVLSVLHKKKLIHRDIKPNNVMIEDSGKVRIIDFGTVKIAKNENTFTINQKGTDNYMSPELLQIIESEADDDEDNDDKEDICHFSVSPKVDVWAVGCLISEIFSGIIPWVNLIGNKNQNAVRFKLKKKTPFPIPSSIENNDIKEAIKKCTEIDLDKRCNIDELKAMIEDIVKKL